MADILSKLGPPVEMLFTSSSHISYLPQYLSLQQHMQVHEIGSYHFQEQEGLEQREECMGKTILLCLFWFCLFL